MTGESLAVGPYGFQNQVGPCDGISLRVNSEVSCVSMLGIRSVRESYSLCSSVTLDVSGRSRVLVVCMGLLEARYKKIDVIKRVWALNSSMLDEAQDGSSVERTTASQSKIYI